MVATPGRLLDHVQQRTVDLSRVEILVLDEADRMLDLGFIRDIRRILGLLPSKRQNLLFSATTSDEIQALAGSFMDAPAVIQAATRSAFGSGRAGGAPRRRGPKRELLAHLITAGNWQQVLVFTRTKHGANRLAQRSCATASRPMRFTATRASRGVRAVSPISARRDADPRGNGYRGARPDRSFRT